MGRGHYRHGQIDGYGLRWSLAYWLYRWGVSLALLCAARSGKFGEVVIGMSSLNVKAGTTHRSGASMGVCWGGGLTLLVGEKPPIVF